MSDPDRIIVVPYKLLGAWLCSQSEAKGSLGSNSLIRGKIQGNFADLATKAGRRLCFPTISQLLTPKFPTYPNREFCRANRELFPAEQGIIQLINADGVFGTHKWLHQLVSGEFRSDFGVGGGRADGRRRSHCRFAGN